MNGVGRKGRGRLLLLGAALAVLVGAQASGAAASNEHATAIRAGLNSFAGTAGQLAGHGLLADAVALTGVQPTGAEGLKLAQVAAASFGGLSSGFDDIDPLADPDGVRAALEALDNPDVGGVAVTVGCPAGATECATPVVVAPNGGGLDLTIPVHAERTVTVPAALVTNLGSFSGGETSVRLTFDTTMPFRYDPALLASSPQDALSLRMTTPAPRAVVAADFTGPAVGFRAPLGFTEVHFGLHDLDSTAAVTALLHDPDGDGRITRDEWSATAFNDLVSLSRSGTVSGELRLDSELVPGAADVTLPFTRSLTTSSDFTFPDIDLGSLKPFTNIRPEDVIAGFGQAAAAVSGAQTHGDVPLPFLSGPLSEAVKGAQPLFDFVSQQGVVCGTTPTTPPTGDISALAADTFVYCQAFVLHPGAISNVSWQPLGPGIVAVENTSGGAADQTIGISPTQRATFKMTQPGAFNARATYSQTPPGETTAIPRQTERPAGTAQQLVEKLVSLGGFENSESEPILGYHEQTQSLQFRLRKTSDPASTSIGYDFGDQLERGTGVVGLSVAAPPAGEDEAKMSVDVSDVGIDVTVGAILVDDIAQIGAGQGCPAVVEAGQPCPPSELDRIFVRVRDDEPELRIGDATFSATAPALRGRLGFLAVDATATAVNISKARADEPVATLDIAAPSSGLAVGSHTIPDAIRLRELLFRLPELITPPTINLGMSGSVTVSATAAGAPLGSGSITITWPDVTQGAPEVVPLGGFTSQLAAFDLQPALFGSHTGATGPTLATATDLPAEVVGRRLQNLTDGSSCEITHRPTPRTVTCALGGGTDNAWDNGDEYRIDGDPLAMLWLLLDNLETMVSQIDGLTGNDDAASTFDTDLPLVGVSPRDLVSQLNDIRRGTTELRGAPGPAIACGTNSEVDDEGTTVDHGPNRVPAVGDPSKLNGAGTVYCSVTHHKPATDVAWSAEGATLVGTPGVSTVGQPATQNAVFAVAAPGNLRSSENPTGYSIQATFTDVDGEHVVHFPEVSVPATLQDFEAAIERKLGLGEDVLTLGIDDSTSPRRLLVGLNAETCTAYDWDGLAFCQGPANASTENVPLNANLGFGTLASVGSDTQVTVDYAAQARLDLAFPLGGSYEPLVMPTTGVRLSGRADAPVSLSANLGPLSLKVGAAGKPGGDGKNALKVGADFTLTGSGSEPKTLTDFFSPSNFRATFTAPPAQTCGVFDQDGDTSTTGDRTEMDGVACALLSLGEGTSSVAHLGDVGIRVASLGSDGSFSIQPFAQDGIETALAEQVLSWDMLLRALPMLLEQLEDGLSGASEGVGKLPLVGDALDGGADVVNRVRSGLVTPLVDTIDEALAEAPNPKSIGDTIQQVLYEHVGPAPGANLLRRSLTQPAVGKEDIQVRMTCQVPPMTSPVSCRDNENAAMLPYIQDVRITFNLGQGTDGPSGEVPFDVGLDGLPLRVAGKVEAAAAWNLLVDFGLNRNLGPYLVVDDASSPTRPKELVVDASVQLGEETGVCGSVVSDDLGGAATLAVPAAVTDRCLAGQLAFVGVNARDYAGADRTKLQLDTHLDLRKQGGGERLGLGELIGGKLDATVGLGVDAKVNLRFRTGIPDEYLAGFPSVLGTFNASWNWSLGSTPQAPTVGFDHLHLDANAFTEKYLKPTLDEVRNITGPFRPVIDTLNAPLPVVSDLAALVGQPPLTLLGLMEELSGNDLEVVKSLAKFIQFANSAPTASGLIPLGGGTDGGKFTVSGTGARSPQTPQTAAALITPVSAGTNLFGKDAKGGENTMKDRANPGAAGADGERRGTFGVPGLTFPFMDDAGEVFGLLMGQDITLVRYDVGTLRATAGFSYDFGPFFIGPVPVTAGLGGSATLTGRFALGYDSSGIRKTLSNGSGVHLFDGIFIDDLDVAGLDVPEVSLVGEVYARAAVTVYVAKAGIEGGIRMTVDLNLDDRPEPDGKLRIEEVFNKLSTPICLFDVSGRLEAFLRAFLEIDYFIDTARWDWEILTIELLNFTKACDPPKPVLAVPDGSTLRLNMGSETLRKARKVAVGEINEKFVVRPVDDQGRYSVSAFGAYQVFGPGITKVVADAGDGKDVLLLEPGSNENEAVGGSLPFLAEAVIDGGPDNDVIKSGDGNDTLTGGAGNDNIDGGAGDDVIRGNGGENTLQGGPGHDVLVGGAETDKLSGGPGADYLDGGAGNDLLNGGPGTGPTLPDGSAAPEGKRDLGDLLAGGGGEDTLEGGWGSDLMYGDHDLRADGGPDGHPIDERLRANAVAAGVLVGSGDPGVACGDNHSGYRDTVDGGEGDDWLYGGGGPDILVGGIGSDVLCGNAGNDDLDGDNADMEASGGGADRLSGGDGADVLLGRSGHDVLSGGAHNDHLVAGLGNDDLRGGSGRDVLEGGPGLDVLVGDDANIAGSDRAARASATQAQRVALVTGVGTAGGGTASCTYTREGSADSDSGTADCIHGGDGHDVVFGEGGADQLHGDDGEDVMRGGAGEDLMRGGKHDDVMHGDDDADEMHGDSGDDRMFGGSHRDLVRGGIGADHMEGNGGADTMHGDAADDRMIGGSSEVGAEDAAESFPAPTGTVGDRMHGGVGDDVMAGDNARIDADGTVTLLDVPTPSSTPPAGTSGNDHMDGQGGEDRMWGQSGGDTMRGGADRDLVVGNAGADTLSGDDGVDLLIGGTSQHATLMAGASEVTFGVVLDGGDTIHGNDGDDIALGDNASVGWDGLASFHPASDAGTYGIDTIRGDAGDDRIWGQLDGDFLYGGAGHDYVVADLGTITPAAEPLGYWPGGAPTYDVLLVEPDNGGADVVDGDEGDDHLFGGAAADTMQGGLGDDYLEGNGGSDTMFGLSSTAGNAELGAVILGAATDQDDLIGGSSSWTRPGADAVRADEAEVGMSGNAQQDVMTGDNADIVRLVEGSQWAIDPITQGRARTVSLLDRERTGEELAAVSGGDTMFGNAGNDRMYGQGGADRMKGDANDDYLEGNQDGDWVEGNLGEDDLIGGSSFEVPGSPGVGDPDGADFLFGGGGADVVTGDNAVVVRDPAAVGEPLYLTTQQRFLGYTSPRWIRLLDLAAPAAGTRYGGDLVSGGSGGDIGLGQDGDDWISGGADEDYLEGNGATDRMYGDRSHTDPTVVGVPTLPEGISGFASTGAGLLGADAPDGQDDLLGGSALAGHRDGADVQHGDGAADVLLGDNGTLTRTVDGSAYAVYRERYAIDAAPADALYLRMPVRFDVGGPTSASGDDYQEGNAGDDTLYGQDGADEQWGNAGHDDLYGELGADRMFGGAGEDAMVGDRGAIVTRLVDGSPGDPALLTMKTKSVPMFDYTTFRNGMLDRRVSLTHDVHPSGDRFGQQLDTSPGLTTGGGDFMRGGPDRDSLHGAFGDDLMNGDSGGDVLFGADGSDVMYGGRGNPDPLQKDDRGTDDRFVDYLFGGHGGDPAADQGIVTGGADLLDYRPRPQDPDAWREVTEPYPGTWAWQDETLAQFSQGVDWIYGGWDRDVLQADLADVGPNQGDRLVDWTGAYNLYTHCPADYGGFNDIRQISPEMVDFLEKLAYGSGAGATLEQVKTAGTSGFRELGLVHRRDISANSDKAYPTTPGHFEAHACA